MKPARTLYTALLLAAALSGQDLLRDLRTGSPDVSANGDPRSFVEFGAHTYFTALDGNGRELWRTDGTTAGTQLVIDLYPGSGPGLLEPTPLIVFQGSLVFVGRTTAGYRLFASDGSAVGTRAFGPMNLIYLQTPESLVVSGKLLYFVASDGVHGFELWCTDGTGAGTRMIKDINTGTASAINFRDPLQMKATATGLLFVATDGAAGLEPWITDGTASGTRMIHDVNPGSGDSSPRRFHVLGKRILFGAKSGSHLYIWWRTDGTSAATTPLTAHYISVAYYRSTVQVGNVLYFSGQSGNVGAELMKTDGTAAGTVLVKDLYPGNYWSNPTEFTVLNGLVYFRARTPNGGLLFKTDGTSAGTTLLSGTARDAGYLTAIHNKLFFTANSTGFGQEPWISDGTTAGTRRLADISAGIYHSKSSHFTAVGNSVVFRADDAIHGLEPWVTDGTRAGTKLLADLHASPKSSKPERFLAASHRTFFTDVNDLWATDGTTANTVKLSSGTWIPSLALDGDALLFARANSIWKVMPYSNTVTHVRQFPSFLRAIARVPGSLYVSVGASLLRLDDAAKNPVVLRSFNLGFYAVAPYGFKVADGSLFFLASEGFGHRSGLWRSDGTTAGTVLVHSGGVGGFSGGLTFSVRLVANDKLWYLDAGTYRNTHLYVADKSSVTDLASFGAGTAQELCAFGRGVAFAGQDSTRGIELWSSDGTIAGTGPITDIRTGAAGSKPSAFATAGGTLFFAADDGVSGNELWRSDGTAAGTVRVADLWPGELGSDPGSIVAAGSGRHIVFAAQDANSGRETWVSDGTAANTRRLAEIAPGPASSDPVVQGRVGTRVLLVARHPKLGREPFVLSLSSTGAWLAQPYGQGCKGSAGVPRLTAKGSARVGATGFEIVISNARPNATATLFAAVTPMEFEFGFGCKLLIGQTIPLVRVVTDATGKAAIPSGIPNNTSLIGAAALFQTILADPGGAYAGALSFSNGLHVMVGR